MQCGWMKNLRVKSTTPTLDSQRSAWKETHGGTANSPATLLKRANNSSSSRGTSITSERVPWISGAILLGSVSKREARDSGAIFQTSTVLSDGSRPKNLGNTGNRV